MALTSTGPVTFYSDAACSTQIAGGNATMAAGSAQLSFHWKDTLAGSPPLTATATGLTAANQVQTVTAGAAFQIAFTTASQNIAPNTCSAAATVEARDQYNNPAPVGSATVVSLSSLPNGLLFYSAAGCGGAATTQVSIASGSSSASFWFKSGVSGAVQVTASTALLGSAVQNESITVGPPTVLAFTSWPLIQTAGACGAMSSRPATRPGCPRRCRRTPR